MRPTGQLSGGQRSSRWVGGGTGQQRFQIAADLQDAVFGRQPLGSFEDGEVPGVEDPVYERTLGEVGFGRELGLSHRDLVVACCLHRSVSLSRFACSPVKPDREGLPSKLKVVGVNEANRRRAPAPFRIQGNSKGLAVEHISESRHKRPGVVKLRAGSVRSKLVVPTEDHRREIDRLPATD